MLHVLRFHFTWKLVEARRQSTRGGRLLSPSTLANQAMTTHSQKRVAYQFLKFLESSKQDLSSEDVESLEVAAQVISEAFRVELSNEQDQSSYSLGQQGDQIGLAQVLDKYIESTVSNTTKEGDKS
jgi:hypothetical protein